MLGAVRASAKSRQYESIASNRRSDLPRILVVDDDDSLRLMLREILDSRGLSCAEAESAENALGKLQPHLRLAVVDISLPGMTGAELGWRIKQVMPGLPLIAVTGHIGTWDPEDLRDLGFDCVFPKPLDCDRFLDQCSRFCAG